LTPVRCFRRCLSELPASYTLHADGTAICLPGDVDARSTESALPSVHDATPKPVQPPLGRH
jgi:hypothetical protein